MGSAFKEESLVYSGFKLPTRPDHYGTDLHPIKNGKKVDNAEVCATSKQTVEFAGWTTSGYGNLVKTIDKEGYKHFYAHLSTIKCKNGDKLNEGQVVGIIGTTGNSTGIHLHYEVRKPPATNQRIYAIDPSSFCNVKNVNGTKYASTIVKENTDDSKGENSLYNMRQYLYSGEKMSIEEFYAAKKATPVEVMAVGKEGDKLLVARVIAASKSPNTFGEDLPKNNYLY